MISAVSGAAWQAFTVPLNPIAHPILDLRSHSKAEISMGLVESHFWGLNGSGHPIYGQTFGFSGHAQSGYTFPGPTILASINEPVSITWFNRLPSQHILSGNIEPTLLMDNETLTLSVIHVHGMATEAKYDGEPTESYGPGVGKTFHYPNQQPATTLVYHDHAMGLTRLNVWAGLVGLYLIQDIQRDKVLGLNLPDSNVMALLIQDRVIDHITGKLVYPDQMMPGAPKACSSSRWIRAALGTVNLVNGIVMPFLQVRPQRYRFKLINGANTRLYRLQVPFFRFCWRLATDQGYVRRPARLPSSLIVMHALERLELWCDFRDIRESMVFNVTDENSSYDNRIFQLRVDVDDYDGVDMSGEVDLDRAVLNYLSREMYGEVDLDRVILNDWKDLAYLWRLSRGLTRFIDLQEDEYDTCSPVTIQSRPNSTAPWHPVPFISSHTSHGASSSTSTRLECVAGTTERWIFSNVGSHWHPFHWHLVNVQCNNNPNELKDVVGIPPNSTGFVCFVGCVPAYHLLRDSRVGPLDFGFDAFQPYVVHCHILEHEENDMMSWFQLL